MDRIANTANVMRRAARGDYQCQMMIALEILDLADHADPFTALFIEIQALCYARLAAAHGEPGALHLAAMIAAKIANHKDGNEIGIAVQEMRADALAMLDVAADVAESPRRERVEHHLHELSAMSDAETARLAQPHREFWGLIVQPDTEPTP
jgi:hypothetical protein